MTPETLLADNDRCNQVIRKAARATGALLIDDIERHPGDPEHFTDTVYFADQGSERMADHVTLASIDSLPPLLAASRG